MYRPPTENREYIKMRARELESRVRSGERLNPTPNVHGGFDRTYSQSSEFVEVTSYFARLLCRGVSWPFRQLSLRKRRDATEGDRGAVQFRKYRL